MATVPVPGMCGAVNFGAADVQMPSPEIIIHGSLQGL